MDVPPLSTCGRQSAFTWLIRLCLLAAGLPLIAGAQSADGVPVVLVEAERDHVVEMLQLTGTVTPRQSAALSPRMSGLVTQVHVDAGDLVEPGDVLLSLDPALAQLALDSARAERDAANARFAESQRLRDEARRLLERNSIPETEVMTREAAVTFAQAAAVQAEVALREHEERLARHDVIAPFAGVITHKLTEAGEWVSTGSPVLRLVSLANARIDVQVPQERVNAIADDTNVDFALDSDPGTSIPARVVARVPVSDPSTRSALVRVVPTNGELALPPGKSARVVFRLRSEQAVLTVPRDALIRRADGTVTVWVADPTDNGWTARKVRVDLGLTFSDRIEITGGLEPGAQVVTRGNETLQEGQALRPVASAPTADLPL